MIALKYMKRNMSRKGWGFFLVSEVLYVLYLGIGFFIPLAQKALIDAVMSATGDISSKVGTSVALAITMSLMFFLSIKLNSKAHGEAVRGLLLKTYERIVGQKNADIKKTGAAWYRSLLYTEALPEMLCSTYTVAAFSVVQLVSILIIITKWDKNYLFAVGAMCLIYLTITLLMAKIKKEAAKNEIRERLAESALVEEGINGASSIARFGKKEIVLGGIKKQVERRIKSVDRIRMINSTSSSLQEMTFSLAMVGLVLISIHGMKSGAISSGSLVTLIAYIPQMLLPCKAVGDIFLGEAWAAPSKDRFIEIQKKFESAIPTTIKIPAFNDCENSNILTLSDIEFSYYQDREQNDRVLEKEEKKIRLSTGFACGFTTALLGVSGDGKSTLLKLIVGEELAAKGIVCLGGEDMRSIPKPLLNAFVNYYSQDVELFNEDVFYNVLMGKECIEESQRNTVLAKLKNEYSENFVRLKAIADRHGENARKTLAALSKELKKGVYANIRNLLGFPLESKLPGYTEEDAIIHMIGEYEIVRLSELFASAEFGRAYCVKEKVDAVLGRVGIRALGGRKIGEKGFAVSGGERQRIALARCLIKENWAVMIIDEPFTSLDVLAENELSTILKEYLNGKTAVLVTHKLNLVPLLATNIIVLKNGEIAEEGSHERLRQKDGLYKTLWDTFIAQRGMEYIGIHN